MSPLRWLYLALAVWGAVHPMVWFVTYMRTEGTGLGGLLDAWFVNASTTGLAWDLTISAIALTVAALAEGILRRDWLLAGAVIVAAYAIGVSCGLPLYLFLRSRPLA